MGRLLYPQCTPISILDIKVAAFPHYATTLTVFSHITPFYEKTTDIKKDVEVVL